ncbi:hypothetical protein CDO44_16685 [Pigmentiphaga sp. NML080357]|uniref:lactonase family protein n=1 Tax=Pigmentiphaga sp. NML080357 TaxID=2008675 RepID=UPI000B40D8DC|nr:lactonase family protein [Pigmentiphaga sp. NML080357]OVZ58008.1 hypothetical protein CDO44_16685 [Pigmentiphaga sp. NML080357]
MKNQHPEGDPHLGFVYTGCRTTLARQARGQGIEVFDLLADGSLHHRHRHPTAPNPSFLCLDAAAKHLYCAHGDGDAVSAFRIQDNGALLNLGTYACGGNNPVHILASRGGRWLLVANFASGNLASLPIKADGSLDAVAHTLPLPGMPGPHRSQQTGAHPHQLVYHPTGDWLAVPDKGTDRVHAVHLDEASGQLTWMHGSSIAAGSGPRHLVYSGDGRIAWIALELSSQVLAARVCAQRGAFTPFERSSTLPSHYTGENTASGIALSSDESRLYVSNRGHDSIACFVIRDGRLSPGGWQETGGRTPRFITLAPDRRALWVANEGTDTIVRLHVAQPPTVLASTGSPVCIVFKPGVPHESH